MAGSIGSIWSIWSDTTLVFSSSLHMVTKVDELALMRKFLTFKWRYDARSISYPAHSRFHSRYCEFNYLFQNLDERIIVTTAHLYFHFTTHNLTCYTTYITPLGLLPSNDEGLQSHTSTESHTWSHLYTPLFHNMKCPQLA